MIAKWPKVKAAQAMVKAENHECFIIRFDLTDHKFTIAERRESQKSARLADISSGPTLKTVPFYELASTGINGDIGFLFNTITLNSHENSFGRKLSLYCTFRCFRTVGDLKLLQQMQLLL